MNAIRLQECMVFMMSVNAGIIYHYGEIFVQCLITYQFQLLLMNVYYVCMEAYRRILIIYRKLMLS